MKVRLNIFCLAVLSILFVSLSAPVFAAVDDPWQNEWNMLQNEEISALSKLQAYMLDQSDIVYGSTDPGGLDINMRFRIADSSAGDITKYADAALESMLTANKLARNVMIVAYYEDTGETAVALAEDFSINLSDSDLKKIVEPLKSNDKILSLRLMQVINNIADIALEKGGYGDSVFEPGVNGETYLANYVQYSEAAGGKNHTFVTIAVLACSTLILIAVLFFTLKRKVTAINIAAPIAAAAVLCAAGYFIYAAAQKPEEPVSGISVTQSDTAADIVGTEGLAALNVSEFYKTGNIMMSPIGRLEGMLTDWWQFGNQCVYSRYTSVGVAEQKLEFFEKLYGIYSNGETEKIEGENFELLIHKDPIGYTIYCLRIDDALYYCLPSSEEMDMMTEFFEKAGIDAAYIK